MQQGQGDVRAYSYNKYPDGHPENRWYAYGVTASFDIESGLIQTGIAYPNSWNSENEPQYASGNIDSSSVEFVGTRASLDFNPDDYRLLEIIVR